MLSTIFTTAVIGTERGPRSVEGPDTNHRNRDTVPSMAAPGAGPECLYQGSWKKGPLPFPLDQPQALDNLQTRTGQRFPFVQAIVTYLCHSYLSFSRGHGLAQKGTWPRVAKIWLLEPTQELFTFNAMDHKRNFISWLRLPPLSPAADLGMLRRGTFPLPLGPSTCSINSLTETLRTVL